ncbi:hypothetical protein [Mycobacterium nebraskense]|uniref:hypothetical protein n=1 Tax=Mycobacterium nebraskense TaxID=244292 RepID=UPI000617D6FA|nr:hypothetical protein [Mycobacterium nebraskense]KKC03452.1 hypothetical protein WU83_18955 [Mycobacterium nebraskense]
MVGTVMAASGQITSGYWAAVLISVVLLLIVVAATTVTMMRGYRPGRKETAVRATAGRSDLLRSDKGAGLWRCPIVITEALIVRQRLTGEIDAQTYRAGMNILARQAISERRPQRNA